VLQFEQKLRLQKTGRKSIFKFMHNMLKDGSTLLHVHYLTN